VRGVSGVAACVAVVFLSLTTPCVTADRPPFTIEPGPSTISPEEAALVPNAAGSQHAIVLTDDTLRDDTLPQLGRHMRVKILSREWRGLGDFTVPAGARSLIKRFWAIVIPPRGPALELGLEDMVRQTIVQRYGYKEQVLKLALPKVTPGSVLDFGYVLASGGGRWTRIPLQEPHDVRQLRYWWAPALDIPSQYHLRRRPGVEATITRGKSSVFLQAANLPVFVDEPWSPSDDLIRAVAVLHYTGDEPNADPNVFWDAVARDEEHDLDEFLKDPAPLQSLITEMALPGGAPLPDKVASAYAWIGSHLRNTGRFTPEQSQEQAALRETELEKEKSSAYVHHRQPDSLADIVARKMGSQAGLDRLFIGVARSLGARSGMVLAANRVTDTWERTLLSRWQFTDSFVAVWAPGETPEKATFADPGSGLPYGIVDWRYTATRLLVTTPLGAREVIVPYQPAQASLMETRAHLRSDPATGSIHVEWSALGSGQRGMAEKDDLRSESPVNRPGSIRELCGEWSGFEVTQADASGWQDDSPYSLRCEGDLAESTPSPQQQRSTASFSGPWIPFVPVLVRPDRVHPIVWHYPWTDHTLIDVDAPQVSSRGSRRAR
jgi:hypothetical protein